jgi:hypothetical protein
MKTFECIEDGVVPKEFYEAEKNGLIQVFTAIGWIDVDETEFRNSLLYRIKED